MRKRGAFVVSGLAAVALGGCAQVLGIGDLHGDGAVTLSGTVLDSHDAILAGVTLTLHLDSGAVIPGLDEQTTIADGRFSFGPVPVPFDGYLELDGAGELHMFEHTLFPVTGDLDQTVRMITMDDLVSLATTYGSQQQAGHSFIVMEVRGADQKPVSGATIATDPAAPANDICYAQGGATNMTLQCGTGATNALGGAVLFDVPAGDLTVTASSGGSTFIPVLASTVIHTSVHP